MNPQEPKLSWIELIIITPIWIAVMITPLLISGYLRHRGFVEYLHKQWWGDCVFVFGIMLTLVSTALGVIMTLGCVYGGFLKIGRALDKHCKECEGDEE